jgi:hypothetical protein
MLSNLMLRVTLDYWASLTGLGDGIHGGRAIPFSF